MSRSEQRARRWAAHVCRCLWADDKLSNHFLNSKKGRAMYGEMDSVTS